MRDEEDAFCRRADDGSFCGCWAGAAGLTGAGGAGFWAAGAGACGLAAGGCGATFAVVRCEAERSGGTCSVLARLLAAAAAYRDEGDGRRTDISDSNPGVGATESVDPG